ncbi:MAG: DUF4035 domain-containing protein [Elusimicrobiales bacterium]
MTVGELLGRISSRELTEWQAYYGIEPFGEERADLRAGIIAATGANVFRGKGIKPYKPQDFMPKFGGETQDWRQMLAKVRIINAALGGKYGDNRQPDSEPDGADSQL